MLGYLEVKSTKRFDDWYASLRDKIAKKAVDRRIARVAAGLFGDVNRVGKISELGVSGFLCLGRLFQGQPNEAALCFL